MNMIKFVLIVYTILIGITLFSQEVEKKYHLKEDGQFVYEITFLDVKYSGNYMGTYIKEKINHEKLYLPHGKGILTGSNFSYEGEWIEGKFHGKGKLVFSKNEYNGDFKHGLLEGEGSLKYENGCFYSGSFHNNLPDGIGSMQYEKGNLYKGEFKLGKKEGNGLMVFRDGTFKNDFYLDKIFVKQDPKFRGKWSNDTIHGEGILYLANGDSIIGNWKNHNFTGFGKVKFDNGNIYEGEWKDWKKVGKGKFSDDKGNKYIGEFNNDLFSGKGEMFFANKDHYLGEFKDGRINGQGEYLENKKLKKGLFINEVLTGQGEIIEGDKHIIGFFQSGKLQGKGYEIVNNDTLVQGEFKDGLLEGECIVKNYVLKLKGIFYNGEPTGIVDIEYHDGVRKSYSGVVKQQNGYNYILDGYGEMKYIDGSSYAGNWENNVQNGQVEKMVYANGDMFQGLFENGVRLDGKMTYKNGDIYQGLWVSNLKNGYGKMKYKKGDVYEGNWDNDLPNGQGTLTLANKTILNGRFENGYYIKPFQCKTTKIGNQTWMAENLNVSKFRNGDEIPEVKDKEQWEFYIENKQPAWCYFNNDSKNAATCGKMYNIWAISDIRGLAPEGWILPTSDDVKNLINILQPEIFNIELNIEKNKKQGISIEKLEHDKYILREMNKKAGYRAKSVQGWNENGSNSSGLNIFRCGCRENGKFEIGNYDLSGSFVTRTYYRRGNAIEDENGNIITPEKREYFVYEVSHNDLVLRDYSLESTGFYVRCIKQ